MLLFLIIYDVSDDRRRNKLAKVLEGYGTRVQYSAFECWLDLVQYNNMISDIEKISHKEDSIRVYLLDKEGMSVGKNMSITFMKTDLYIV